MGEVEEVKQVKVLSSRTAILDRKELKRELVVVDEWLDEQDQPVGVWVRELTAEERDDYEASMIQTRQKGNRLEMSPDFRNTKARLAARCIIDEDGQRLFTDADARALGKLSAAALNRIAEAISRLSGLREKDIEELEGNSLSGQSEDSSSG